MAGPLEKRSSFRIARLSSTETDSEIKASLLQHRNSIYKKPDDKDKDGGIMHTIPDITICEKYFTDEYDIEKTVAEGCFAKILLATHRQTKSTVVLKAVHAELTNQKEFIKEFHYSYQLSHHPNILAAYNVTFQTKDYYVFAQEYAPYGDLASNLRANGLHESACKLISTQLSAALSFMHSKMLVHRDLKLENVLIFATDFSRIKLCDFGSSMKKGILVGKVKHTWTSFIPPEVLEIVKNERLICRPASDSFQFGILLYTILTGSPPWQSADWVKDSNYSAFMKYQQKKTTKIPDTFKRFSTRLIRCFRKYFDHDPEDRCKVTEITKYMKDRWVECKLSSSKSAVLVTSNAEESDHDSICVYLNHRGSRHSTDENRARLRRLMSSFGLDASFDQNSVKKRVWEWLATCQDTFEHELENILVENLTAQALALN